MASRAAPPHLGRAHWLLLASLLLPACGPSEVSAPPPDEKPEISGMYRVRGLTTVIGTNQSREISGTVILVQNGSSYTATFDLKTNYPGPDGALRADVIGTGEGRIEGSSLKGSTQTQILASRVPGLDPGFTLVPHSFGVRVVSNAEGTIKSDGSLEFHLENRGAKGEAYIPTRTSVTGVRVPE